MLLQEDSEPGREKTLQMRVLDLERKRYENARWWRNLNRWMIPLGLVIITIIVGILSRMSITLVNIRCRSHWLLWERRWASSVINALQPIFRPCPQAMLVAIFSSFLTFSTGSDFDPYYYFLGVGSFNSNLPLAPSFPPLIPSPLP